MARCVVTGDGAGAAVCEEEALPANELTGLADWTPGVRPNNGPESTGVETGVGAIGVGAG